MLNTKFTNSAITNNKHLIKRKYKLVFDAYGNVLCGIRKKDICDLNGKKIATFLRNEKSNTKNVKQRVYESEQYGIFKLVGSALFLNDIREGTCEGGPNKSSILLLIVTSLVLAITFGVVAIIDTPDDSVIVISLSDDDGVIDKTRKIAVFDNSIAPGSLGEYYFDITNPHSRDLIYSFNVQELYNGETVDNFPMRYRIRMNNLYIVNEDEWVVAERLSFTELDIHDRSTTQFTLEWYWPFESGNDTLDTYFGNDNGEYSIVVNVTATFAEGA